MAPKDKATCVRDLIYQTIDYTFNSSDKSTAGKEPIKEQKPSIYFPAELKRDAILGDLSGANKLTANPLQHLMPYNLSNPLGLSISGGTSGGHLNEIDEVQDLSKKGGKKETVDEYLPKYYSLSKSKNSDFVLSLGSFNTGASAMPPPAHSNQLTNRTATPVLDMSASAQQQQEQLQNFDLNRHTDSPRSLKNQSQLYSPLEPRLGTPNHHLLSASPTAGGNSRTGSKQSGSASAKVNIAPPPLIANSLISAANQQQQQQFSG